MKPTHTPEQRREKAWDILEDHIDPHTMSIVEKQIYLLEQIASSQAVQNERKRWEKKIVSRLYQEKFDDESPLIDVSDAVALVNEVLSPQGET